MEGKLLLTVTEVVAATGYSRSQVHKWIREGQMPGVVRLGKTVRVSSEALRQWVDEKIKGTADAARG